MQDIALRLSSKMRLSERFAPLIVRSVHMPHYRRFGTSPTEAKKQGDGKGWSKSKELRNVLIFGTVVCLFVGQELRERFLWSYTEISAKDLAALRQFTASTLHADASSQLGRKTKGKAPSVEESIIAANDLLKQLRDYFLRITENAPKLKSYVWERKVTFGADAALREEASSHSNAVLLADALFTGADEDMDDALTFEDFSRLVITLASAAQGAPHAQETLVTLLQEPTIANYRQPLSFADLADLYCAPGTDMQSMCGPHSESTPESRRILWQRCLQPATLQGLRGLQPAFAAVKQATERLGGGEYHARTEQGKAEEEERARRREAREEAREGRGR